MQKTILITGANRGIGFETARQLGIKGHRIIVSGRNEERVEWAVLKLKQEKAESLLMDISDIKKILEAAREFGQRGIRLDVLINNAGVLLRSDRSILNEDENVLTETISTNSLGALHVSRAFLPYMNNPSRIINISSGGGSMTDPVEGWAPVYCISKTLLNAITRHLAHELQNRNISVNALCPGWVRTEMGGKGATRSVEKGAETPVWLAAEAPGELTGKIFRDNREIPW